MMKSFSTALAVLLLLTVAAAAATTKAGHLRTLESTEQESGTLHQQEGVGQKLKCTSNASPSTIKACLRPTSRADDWNETAVIECLVDLAKPYMFKPREREPFQPQPDDFEEQVADMGDETTTSSSPYTFNVVYDTAPDRAEDPSLDWVSERFPGEPKFEFLIWGESYQPFANDLKSCVGANGECETNEDCLIQQVNPDPNNPPRGYQYLPCCIKYGNGCVCGSSQNSGGAKCAKDDYFD
eukprot:CAMPEP_0194046732 /NCGR_PEP_ID=MMETSP0009_2-20130614/22272_1 /TAXON_ID=210454 /ORGANISM="Grammatophora oceanica, Strain CCMP 410" /LENGTH=239 /DNA_ID=CAMNT_0038692137 /DNA_START=94 /DNA_END=813 /DNA_ORIENTATION=-